jgi:hypothetical protein
MDLVEQGRDRRSSFCMLWVCVLNSSNETFETRVKPLLAEAYDLAVSKYQRRASSR